MTLPPAEIRPEFWRWDRCHAPRNLRERGELDAGHRELARFGDRLVTRDIADARLNRRETGGDLGSGILLPAIAPWRAAGARSMWCWCGASIAGAVPSQTGVVPSSETNS